MAGIDGGQPGTTTKGFAVTSSFAYLALFNALQAQLQHCFREAVSDHLSRNPPKDPLNP